MRNATNAILDHQRKLRVPRVSLISPLPLCRCQLFENFLAHCLAGHCIRFRLLEKTQTPLTDARLTDRDLIVAQIPFTHARQSRRAVSVSCQYYLVGRPSNAARSSGDMISSVGRRLSSFVSAHSK